eukprot:COSAG01_NODE_31970_length_588_cov_1.368098_1_plen_50_part_00
MLRLRINMPRGRYGCLRRRGMAVLSVGHRPSLVALHDTVHALHDTSISL